MTDTGAFLALRYDLRAPAFGPPAEALYRAALEQCAWAEDNGFLVAPRCPSTTGPTTATAPHRW